MPDPPALTRLDPSPPPGGCSICSSLPLACYCPSCKQHLCSSCSSVHSKLGSTRAHLTSDPVGSPTEAADAAPISPTLQGTSEKGRLAWQNLKALVQKSQILLQELDAGLKETEGKRALIEKNAGLAREEISTSFKRFQKALEVRERQLQGQLTEISQDLVKSLTIHQGEIETVRELLLSTQISAEKTLNKGTEIELLAMERQLDARLRDIKPAKWEDARDLGAVLDFSATNESQYDKLVVSLGSLVTNNTDPLLSKVDSKPMASLSKDQSCSFTITLAARGGAPIKRGGDPLKVSVRGPARTKCTVVDHQNGTYTATFVPTADGVYQIKVQLRGKHVGDSPFTATLGSVTKSGIVSSGSTPDLASAGSSPAWTPIETAPLHRASTVLQAPKKPRITDQRNYAEVKKVSYLVGGKGTGDGLLNYPADVAVTSKADLVVSDRYSHRIQIFNSSGTFLLTFGRKGAEDGQFSEPWGVAVDNLDNIFVADRYNHRIQIFSRDGKFLRKVGSHGTGEMHLSEPCGIAVDTLGNLYVAENGNHRIHIFDRKGANLMTFGTKGNEPGQFVNPFSVAISSTGEILVSDMGNHRIQRFSPFKATGGCQFVSSFGGKGTASGHFFFPSFVSLDHHDQILVADCNNKRVQVFSQTGQFVGKLPVADPSGMVVAHDGTVWVCDFSTNYIKGL